MDTLVERIVGEIAESRPEKVALICQGRELRYAELARKTRAMAAWLASQGIRPGERVALVLPDSLCSALSILGCFLAGVVVVPLSERLRQADIAGCLKHCAPRLLIASPGHEGLAAATETGVPAVDMTDDAFPRLLDGLPAEHTPCPAAPEDTCVIFYTSGTTGRPKGVPHSHAALSRGAQITGRDFFGLREDDIIFCSVKLYHIYGWFLSLIYPLAVGATALLDAEKPNPTRTLGLLRENGVTVLASVPAIYSLLLLSLENSPDFARLRICVSSGEILPAAVCRAWQEKTGLPLWQVYGFTEAGCLALGSRPPDILPGSVGRVIPPCSAKILDEALRPVPPGTPGQLAVHTPTLMSGYLDDPERTARAFTPDGWYLTGDMASEEDGVFTILGRVDDMFKAGGLWVSPTRVENVLLSHPAVAQCGVVGARSGAFTTVRAHVVPAPGHEPGPTLLHALRAHAQADLPAYMVPTDIVFQDSLPLTAMGKVRRHLLRKGT